MLLKVRADASTERCDVLHTESRCVVLDLTKQRVAAIMQHATYSTSRVVVVEARILDSARQLTQGALTILCTQILFPRRLDLRML